MIPETHPIRRVEAPLPYGADLERWKTAKCLDQFVRPWNLGAPVPRTEFRAVTHDETFAFRFDVTDNALVLAEGETEPDRVLGSDRAELFLSTTPELSTYYCLEIDPRGNLLDYRAEHYRQMDWSWSMPELSIDTEITRDGYRVEGRIPMPVLEQLGVIQADGSLIAGVFRANFSLSPTGETLQDWMPWIDPKTDTPDFHVPEAFGRLILEV